MGNVDEKSVQLGLNVKLELAFSAKHERELLKAIYINQLYGENVGNLHRGSGTEAGGRNCSLVYIGKKRNHVEVNGNLLRCKSCGSYSHLVAEYPGSWEYM